MTHTFSLRLPIILAGMFICFLSFVGYTHAAPQSYFFNNAVNTNPATLGNYWYNQAATNPALEVPDSTQKPTSVLSGATYAGNATFIVTSTNAGTVTGNATFMGDNSENNGTVTGTKTRYYTQQTTPTRDFVTGGPWTVVADGAQIDVSGATYNGSTTFSAINGGSFVYIVLSSESASGSTITFTYNKSLLNTSVPSSSDFSVLVNGNSRSVSNVGISGANLTLTLAQALTPSDILYVSYTPGSAPIEDLFSKPAASFSNLGIPLYIDSVANNAAYATLVGTKLYTLNRGSYGATADSLSVIDTLTDTATTITGTGSQLVEPFGSAFVGNKLYVSGNGADGSGHYYVTVVNTLTDTVSSIIQVSGQADHELAVGNKVYVNIRDGAVAVINTITDTLEATISVGSAPYDSIAMNNKLYVSNQGTPGLNSTVSVIDLSSNTVTATIPAGMQPYYLTSYGTKIYLTNNESNEVTVINSTNNTVITTIPVGTAPESPVVVGNKIYVSCASSDNVYIIDPSTDTVTGTISGFGFLYPNYPAVVGSNLFINQPASSENNVKVVNTNTDTISDTLGAGTGPAFLALSGNKVYALNRLSNNVSVYNVNTIPSLLPNLVSFTTSAISGIYTSGQTINITANFGRPLLSGSTMTVALNSGGSAVLNTVSGSTLSGIYTIGSMDATPDLSVSSIISASVSDSTNTYTRTSYSLPSSQGSFSAENSFITRNIGDSKNIVIESYLAIPVGNNPYQVSAPINGYIYVANQGSGTVSVIRISDNTVVSTISVGSEPYGLSTADVSGVTYLYVANTGSNTVSVINTSTNVVVATVSVGVKPYYAATIGTNVYVTNGQSNTVSVINANTNTVSATIPVGLYPRGIKAHGTDLYVANYGDPNYSGGNYISVINSLNNTVSANIILPGGSTGPRGVTVLGSKVYVANFRSNNVTVINTVDNTVSATIAVGVGPRGMAAVGTNVYVENFDDGTISVINTNTNTVSATIKVGHSPAGMGVSGTDIYFSRFQDNEVSILDTTTNTLRAIPSTGGGGDGAGHVGASLIPAFTAHPEPIPMPDVCASGGVRCGSNNEHSHLHLTKTLRYLLQDSEVTLLQQFLNQHGFPLAIVGPGSPAHETNFFGIKTKSAVIKFQEAYRDDILKPYNLTKGTGLVGYYTRAMIERL